MAKNVVLLGSDECPYCREMKEALAKENIAYEYVNVQESLGNLKKFLNVRDQNPEAYKAVREGGKVGVPTLVVDEKDVYVTIVANMDFSLLK